MPEPPEHRACRSVALDERVPVLFVGGPLAGKRDRRSPILPTPPYRCVRQGSGPWQHYLHEGAGVYQYVGLCVAHHERGDMPEDWPTGCGASVDNPVDNERSGTR
jgi:hypothetical protein